MGLSVAPATESIMGSLPLHQAGVGSAVNDTSREVGGALGVAIVGSMLSSLYSANLNGKLPADVPAPVRDAADQSVGAALQVSAQLGRVGAPLADAARESFVYAMSRASLVTAAVAVVGALAGVALPPGPRRRGARPRGGRRRSRSSPRRADSAGLGDADRAAHAGAAEAAVAAGVLRQVLLVVVLGVVEGRSGLGSRW